MAWTTDDLDKIEAAIAEGATRVKYKDKEIEYRSLREMERIRDKIKRELGQKGSKTVKVGANYCKGLD